MGYINWKKIKLYVTEWYPSRNSGLIVLKIPVRFTQISNLQTIETISSRIKSILYQKIEVETGVKPDLIEMPPTYSALSPKNDDGSICINTKLRIVGDDFWKLYFYFIHIK